MCLHTFTFLQLHGVTLRTRTLAGNCVISRCVTRPRSLHKQLRLPGIIRHYQQLSLPHLSQSGRNYQPKWPLISQRNLVQILWMWSWWLLISQQNTVQILWMCQIQMMCGQVLWLGALVIFNPPTLIVHVAQKVDVSVHVATCTSASSVVMLISAG